MVQRIVVVYRGVVLKMKLFVDIAPIIAILFSYLFAKWLAERLKE